MKYFLLFLLVFSLLPSTALALSSVTVTVNATPDWLGFNVTPTGFVLGPIEKNSVHWAKGGGTPTFPLDNGNCTYLITNLMGSNLTIYVTGADLVGTGGYKWDLESSIGADQYSMKAGRNGTVDLASMVTLNMTAQNLIPLLVGNGTTRFEMVLYAPSSFSSGGNVTGVTMLSASVV